jgi:broad specificity phosphatase PhoE
MKYSLLLALLLPTFNIQASDSFTIYLTRHAEKQSEQKNPKLTECGVQRAQQLASILEKVKIEGVYSTSYNRTMATAAPTAEKQGLVVEQYSPAKLAEFSQKLLKQKESVLVVGHSNTTPQLSALLSGVGVAEITEKEFSNLYQIQISDSGKTLTLLTQPLTCH